MTEELASFFFQCSSPADSLKPDDTFGADSVAYLNGTLSKVVDPWRNIKMAIKISMKKDAPVSNAFLKMHELMHLPELDEKVRTAKELKTVFVADFPGTFRTAMGRYIGAINPELIRSKKWIRVGTSLDPSTDSEGGAAGDDYGLYAQHPKDWFLMDHTSVEDTLKMEKEIGAHTADIVTGDIGKNLRSWVTQEENMFCEQYGQFLATCILLKDDGVAMLKMFQSFSAAGCCMLRLATAFFQKSRIYKPRSSWMANNEVYWVLSGFKKDLFDKHKTDLLTVLSETMSDRSKDHDIIPRPFLPRKALDDEFLKEVEMVGKCKSLSLHGASKMIAYHASKYLGKVIDPKKIQFDVAREYSTKGDIYAETWVHRYPIREFPNDLTPLL